MWFLGMVLLLGAATGWQEPAVENVHLAGRVVNAEDGSPVKFGNITFNRNGGDRFNVHIRDGKLQGVVAPGEGYRLVVWAPGFEGFQLNNVVVFDGMEPILFKLRPTRVLRGQVVDSAGEGIAGARVGIALDEEGEDMPMVTPADADGFFQMEFATEPGVYYLFAFCPGFEDKTVPFEHPVDREVRIQLSPSRPAPAKARGSIAGILTLAGRSLADHEVWLMPAEGGESLSTRSDAQGRFWYPDVAVGKYWLETRRDDPWVPKPARQSRMGVEVTTGGPTHVQFALFDGHLTGVVVDADGNPVGDVALDLAPGYGGSSHTRSDGDGYFFFSGLQPGSYLLNIRSWPDSSYQESRMSVEVPRDDGLRIVLQPALRLRGVLLDANGEVIPAFNYRIGLADESGNSVSSTVDSLQGLFVIDGLKLGVYSFRVDLPDGRHAEGSVDLNLGTNVLFQMPAIEGNELKLRYER